MRHQEYRSDKVPIYVDETRQYASSMIKGQAKHYGRQWCHLFTDGTLEDLHSFAKSIGCRRGWFQEHNSRFPHYDLTPARRAKAIEAGAVPIPLKEWLRRTR